MLTQQGAMRLIDSDNPLTVRAFGMGCGRPIDMCQPNAMSTQRNIDTGSLLTYLPDGGCVGGRGGHGAWPSGPARRQANFRVEGAAPSRGFTSFAAAQV